MFSLAQINNYMCAFMLLGTSAPSISANLPLISLMQNPSDPGRHYLNNPPTEIAVRFRILLNKQVSESEYPNKIAF